MKQTKIIHDSTSSFNFPLVVVKKKKDSEGKQNLSVSIEFLQLKDVIEN